MSDPHFPHLDWIAQSQIHDAKRKAEDAESAQRNAERIANQAAHQLAESEETAANLRDHLAAMKQVAANRREELEATGSKVDGLRKDIRVLSKRVSDLSDSSDERFAQIEEKYIDLENRCYILEDMAEEVRARLSDDALIQQAIVMDVASLNAAADGREMPDLEKLAREIWADSGEETFDVPDSFDSPAAKKFLDDLLDHNLPVDKNRAWLINALSELYNQMSNDLWRQVQYLEMSFGGDLIPNPEASKDRAARYNVNCLDGSAPANIEDEIALRFVKYRFFLISTALDDFLFSKTTQELERARVFLSTDMAWGARLLFFKELTDPLWEEMKRSFLAGEDKYRWCLDPKLDQDGIREAFMREEIAVRSANTQHTPPTMA